MKIITSEVDAGLNESNRVVPGVGEFGTGISARRT